MIKKILISFILILTLASCSTDKKTTAKTVEEIITNAQEKNKNAKSMTYSMDTMIDIKMGIASISSNIHLDAEAIVEPLKLKMKVNIDMGSGSTDTDMYMEKVDDGYVMYMSLVNPENNQVNWYKQKVTDFTTVEQYSASENLEVFFDNAANYSEIGKETVNGIETTKFQGVISGEKLSEVLTSPQLSSYTSEIDQSEISFDKLEDLPVIFYIDTENLDLIKMDMDMSTIMKGVFEQLQQADSEYANLTFSIDKVIFSITFTGYNNVENIEIPQEAIDQAIEIHSN